MNNHAEANEVANMPDYAIAVFGSLHKANRWLAAHSACSDIELHEMCIRIDGGGGDGSMKILMCMQSWYDAIKCKWYGCTHPRAILRTRWAGITRCPLCGLIYSELPKGK